MTAEPQTRGHYATRATSLPEHMTFADTGCEYAPKCLECPFARCRYDVDGGLRVLRNLTRDASIRSRRAEGVSPDQLAADFAVSRRTIFRILEGRA